MLWFAEVARRALYQQLGHASLQLCATRELGFSDNRYHQFKRLADDLDRLPTLREAVAAGQIGWTKAQQVARVAAEATQAAWVAKAATTGRRELERQARRAGRPAGRGQLRRRNWRRWPATHAQGGGPTGRRTWSCCAAGVMGSCMSGVGVEHPNSGMVLSDGSNAARTRTATQRAVAGAVA